MCTGSARTWALSAMHIACERDVLTWRNVAFGVNWHPERRRDLELKSSNTAFARDCVRHGVWAACGMASVEAHGLAVPFQMLVQLLAQETASELVGTRHGPYGEAVRRPNLYRIGRGGGHAMQVEHRNCSALARQIRERLLVCAGLERIPVRVASIVSTCDNSACSGQFSHDERHRSCEIVGGLHAPFAQLRHRMRRRHYDGKLALNHAERRCIGQSSVVIDREPPEFDFRHMFDEVLHAFTFLRGKSLLPRYLSSHFTGPASRQESS